MRDIAVVRSPSLLWRRSLVVWLVLIAVEILHGTLRTIFLAPRLGDLWARQVGVFTGTLLNFGVAWAFVGWMRASGARVLLGIGLLWLALTVGFEIAFGRLVMRSTWQAIVRDYDPRRGGLLPIGLAALTVSPLLAAKLRGVPAIRTGRLTDDIDGSVCRCGNAP